MSHSDPGRYESEHARLEGLGLLPTETVFTPDKRTVRVQGVSTLFASNFVIDGYEIHMGRTQYVHDNVPPFQIAPQLSTDLEEPHETSCILTEPFR